MGLVEDAELELGVPGELFDGFDDAVEGSGFTFLGDENGGDGVGTFGKLGGEGDHGVLFPDGLGGDFLAIDTERGGLDVERDSIIGAEGLRCSRTFFPEGREAVMG